MATPAGLKNEHSTADGDALPDFTDRAPRDRFCDLILTGGVTSAIAYPGAIFALASAYRFNSIGGSSSGAGAAALAAAAEYRRRHGSPDGFRVLLERTHALSDHVHGKTGLAWLFQPAPQNKRLFAALVPAVARPDHKLRKLATGLLGAYWLSIAAGLLIAYGLVEAASCCGGSAQGWVAYVSLSVITVIAALTFSACRDVLRAVNNDYGLCSGMDSLPGAPHPPLTQWLHDLIQEIAGRKTDGPPLTFADLADAPGSPQETLGDLSPTGAVSIGLQMFTANVNHGRPYLLPQKDEDPSLYFRPSEMCRLFPRTVVEHMMKHSTRHAGSEKPVEPVRSVRMRRFSHRPAAESAATIEHDNAMWLFPTKHLPIVVASRMSISFPVLFTAVPLWVLDGEARPSVFRRCLFSDGGLCSNFPIHMFDCLVPAWPTFGISLHERLAGHRQPAGTSRAQKIEEAVWLPESHDEQQKVRWSDFEQKRRTIDRLFGFAGAMLSTVKDWNDATLAQLPGVRDRVVQVDLDAGTGGLNILMDKQQIESLGQLGGEAGRRLLKRFTKASTPDGIAFGWHEHRWVRFNLLRECLSESLAGLTWSAAQGRYGKPLREQIRDATEDGPLKDRKNRTAPLFAAEAAALDGVLIALREAERALTAPTVGKSYKPFPRPEFRIRPRL